jgi:1,4-dihydroxy-2-naphthoate octaprenyltransferase
LIAGVFYTVKPFQFKYIALGDVLIFLAFGPILVLGSYFALTGDMNWNVIWSSFPISFLVVGILHANNTRDMKYDKQAHIKTFAGIIGIKGAKLEYYFLITGAYMATVILVVSGIVDWYVLLVVLSLPVAIKNIKQFSKASFENPKGIAMLDVQTAQLHMQFGLLFVISMLLSALL